jgi:hypothetical protein
LTGRAFAFGAADARGAPPRGSRPRCVSRAAAPDLALDVFLGAPAAGRLAAVLLGAARVTLFFTELFDEPARRDGAGFLLDDARLAGCFAAPLRGGFRLGTRDTIPTGAR